MTGRKRTREQWEDLAHTSEDAVDRALRFANGESFAEIKASRWDNDEFVPEPDAFKKALRKAMWLRLKEESDRADAALARKASNLEKQMAAIELRDAIMALEDNVGAPTTMAQLKYIRKMKIKLKELMK